MKTNLIALFLLAALVSRAEDPIRPDPKLTPGAVFTNVTVEQVTQKGYANRLNGGVRHVTAAVKRQVFTEYFGRVPGMQGHYEIDHLISLELGGNNDPKNLWPESYYTEPFNAHVKDKLEDRMAANVRHELERHGHDAASALLKQYQHEIATDWIAAYHKYVSQMP
ncbi:MAG TPA: HNH endonuclease signature motif containing protein [Verrucomicrobiae bacterium]|jgi:hypothetical protein